MKDWLKNIDSDKLQRMKIICVCGLVGSIPAIFVISFFICRCSLLKLPDPLLVILVTGPLILVLWAIRIWHKERDLEVDHRRLFSESFRQAVDQLGSDKEEVRLGGIYSLERLAEDSVRDHWTIMETLAAFIRRRAPWPPDLNTEKKSKPSTDIQTALTVLGRRKHRDAENEHQRINLSETDLRGANLDRLHFEAANFSKTHLEEAILPQVYLFAANLTEAHLNNAYILNANLDRTFITRTIFDGADLRFTDLSQVVDWDKAIWTGAKYIPGKTIFPRGFDPEEHGMIAGI